MNFTKFQQLVEERAGFRTMENPTATGEYFSDSCGDMYTYYLKVAPGDVIADVSYFTTGCGFGTATCSLLVDLALGKTIAQAYAITEQEIEDQLGGYPEKKKDYPGRSLNALRAAIDDYRAKRAAGTVTDAMLADGAASAVVAKKSEASTAAGDDGKITISLH